LARMLLTCHLPNPVVYSAEWSWLPTASLWSYVFYLACEVTCCFFWLVVLHLLCKFLFISLKSLGSVLGNLFSICSYSLDVFKLSVKCWWCLNLSHQYIFLPYILDFYTRVPIQYCSVVIWHTS
jgi:hypothetical protein